MDLSVIGHLLAAKTAARELGACRSRRRSLFACFYEAEGDPRFEKAFRWLSRVRTKHALKHEQVELLRAAAGSLSTSFRSIGPTVIEAACLD